MSGMDSADGRRAVRALCFGGRAVVGLLVCHMATGAAPDTRVATADSRQSADSLLIVDCVLPAQVRQLGAR